VEGIIFCLHKALSVPRDHKATSIIPILSKRLLVLCDKMVRRGLRKYNERKVTSGKATASIEALKRLVAATMVNGSQNCRILSCARAADESSPAVSWLPPYVD